MWPAEISDKTSPADLVVLSVALALGTGAISNWTWVGRIVAICLVSLWDLGLILELTDTSFVAVARLEFGFWYERSLVAAALIPLLTVVGVSTAAWVRNGGKTRPR